MQLKIGAIIGIVAAVILFIIILSTAIWSISTYNKFVEMDESIDGEWAEVENQYQRKFDLIGQLVNLTDVYLNYENSTLTDITELRTRWMNADSSDEHENVSEQFNTLANSIIVQIENYPILQADDIVQDLMTELEGTENRITVARMRYNEEVKDLNTKVKQFPSVIIANMGGFEEREYFESGAAPDNP
jgi:LemA protein